LLLLWLSVDAIQGRRSGTQQLTRHGDVREDHALLDQAVGIVAGAKLDGTNVADLIDAEFRLGGVEVKRAAASARPMQCTVELDQHEEPLRQRPELASRL